MKNITIRGIDDRLDQALKTIAGRDARSVNQLVLDVLRERFGLAKAARHSTRHHDLDGLFGAWSEEEYLEVQGAVEEQRTLDPELWSCDAR
jgi:hypothetical protein